MSFVSPADEQRIPLGAGLELVLAGALWGFGFVATVWALNDMGPLMLTLFRFAWISLIGFPLLMLVPRWRRTLSMSQWRLSFWPGFWLAATIIIQTFGLRYTSASKSGFITTLYVLMVPALESFWHKRRLPRRHWFYAFVALLGVALMMDLQKTGWNVGDGLTLVCAVAATLQIFWFGLIAEKIESALTFNLLQSSWAALIALPAALIFEPWPKFPLSNISFLGLIALTFGSTAIAFGLQIKAQRVISPSRSSLFFLLESPFAALFAYILLGEVLSPSQWCGGLLILVSLSLSTLRAVKN